PSSALQLPPRTGALWATRAISRLASMSRILAVASSLPVTRYLPSALKASADTAPAWLSSAMTRPPGRPATLTVPCVVPKARRLASRLNANALGSPTATAGRTGERGCPVRASHTRTCSRSALETRYLPSLLRRGSAKPKCGTVAISRPLPSRAHRRAVLLASTVTSVFSSVLKNRCWTAREWRRRPWSAPVEGLKTRTVSRSRELSSGASSGRTAGGFRVPSSVASFRKTALARRLARLGMAAREEALCVGSASNASRPSCPDQGGLSDVRDPATGCPAGNIAVIPSLEKESLPGASPYGAISTVCTASRQGWLRFAEKAAVCVSLR